MATAVDQTISHMTLVDWLDDLTVRFLLNLPPTELSSVPRLCFQVEEAQWFYEDFIRPANPALPSLNLRQFCLTLFQHCPLLSGFNAAQHLAAYEEFLAYKVRVPVRGAILMDESMDKVLLVRGWKKGASWSFPRGKINKDEPDLDCAVREVYEETGFDLQAAGLVERNEIGDGKVKAIDVTMREQHMKLFVFRGVALDTYFEPRTRKEISKIQWYNVKDLPGFKKQKGVAGHGQGEAESIKFYMVAPFLGHLKKWIGQQRRKDSTAATQVQHARNISMSQEAVHATITEDEGEDTELGFATDSGLQPIDRSAEELKRLLSIGGSVSAPNPLTQSAQSPNGTQANSLLSMLRGNIVAPASGTLPHTPFGQVDPVFPEQAPQTPQPQHPRHTSVAAPYHQNAPPQFQCSPQTMQQGLQQQQSQRHSAAFTSGMAEHSNHQHLGTSHLPPYIQQQLFQQQQRQQSLPTNFPLGQASGAQFDQRQGRPGFQQIPQLSTTRDAYAHGLPTHLQSTADQNRNPMQPLSFPDMSQPDPTSGHASNAQYSPIGSEKDVPEASTLPAPKLNAHSMKLLDAFKTGPRTPRPGSTNHTNNQPSGTQHRTALLDLFRKPSTADAPAGSAKSESVPVSASPALTDATEVLDASRSLDRDLALNEITRTVPPRVDAKSSALPVKTDPVSIVEAPSITRGQPARLSTPRATSAARGASGSTQAAVPLVVHPNRSKSRGQLFDPAQPTKFVRTASKSKQPEPSSYVAPISTAPRSSAQVTSRGSKSPRPTARAPAHASPKLKSKQTRYDNGQPRQTQPMPQFSILQRPGSSRTSAPLSSLHDEAPVSIPQPQVLKRESAEVEDDRPVAQQQSRVLKTPATGDKKDTLLALFGKTPLPAAPAPASDPATGASPAPSVAQPQSAGQQSNPLLDLFKGNRADVTTRTSEPPAPPQLLPERNPSVEGQRPHNSQQHLLNLFTKPSANASNRLNSPGTPISPFTLGTPATNTSVEKLPSAAHGSRINTPRGSEPGSRLGSRAGVITNGAGVKSSAQTPTEAKDLLLGYLNGVVQKEGHRGAKKST